MNVAMQDHANEQTTQLERLTEEHQALIDAARRQLALQTRQSAAVRWGNKVPDWFIAVGYAAGLISLIILAEPVLVDIGRFLATCR